MSRLIQKFLTAIVSVALAVLLSLSPRPVLAEVSISNKMGPPRLRGWLSGTVSGVYADGTVLILATSYRHFVPNSVIDPFKGGEYFRVRIPGLEIDRQSMEILALGRDIRCSFLDRPTIAGDGAYLSSCFVLAGAMSTPEAWEAKRLELNPSFLDIGETAMKTGLGYLKD